MSFSRCPGKPVCKGRYLDPSVVTASVMGVKDDADSGPRDLPGVLHLIDFAVGLVPPKIVFGTPAYVVRNVGSVRSRMCVITHMIVSLASSRDAADFRQLMMRPGRYGDVVVRKFHGFDRIEVAAVKDDYNLAVHLMDMTFKILQFVSKEPKLLCEWDDGAFDWRKYAGYNKAAIKSKHRDQFPAKSGKRAFAFEDEGAACSRKIVHL